MAKANYEVRLRCNPELRLNLMIESLTELLEGGGLKARWDVGALGRLGGGTKAKYLKDKKPFPRRP